MWHKMAREMGMLRVTIAKQVDVEGWSVWTQRAGAIQHWDRQSVSHLHTCLRPATREFFPPQPFRCGTPAHFLSHRPSRCSCLLYFSHPSPSVDVWVTLGCKSFLTVGFAWTAVFESSLGQGKHVHKCPFHAIPKIQALQRMGNSVLFTSALHFMK